MDTAVIILNWNGKNMLSKYLPSVIEYTSNEAEIWVADNNSSDASLEMIKERFPLVHTLAFDCNYGFAEGYNKAIQKINTKYCVLLNSDVEVTRNWLSALLDFMQKNQEVVACQPKILSICNRTSFEYAGACGGFLDKYGYPFCRGRIFYNIEQDEKQYEDPIEVMWATGACMLIRTEAYLKAGGLDSRFFAHCEEIDLCWRLRLNGWKIYCLPQSHVFHLGGGTLKQGDKRKTFLNYRNNLTMLYKNLPEKNLKKVMRMRLLLDMLAAIQALILKGDYSTCKAIISGRRAFSKWKHNFDAERKNIGNIKNRYNEGKNSMPMLAPFSILWRYYVLKQRKFSQLNDIK